MATPSVSSAAVITRSSLAFRGAEKQDLQSHCEPEQDSAYEQPAGGSPLVTDVEAIKVLLCRNGFSVAD